jgi:protein-L-isoaspartate(D-aspartate) O-methyltransferase
MNYAEARAQMVQHQLAERGITDARVLQAMGEIPRELFVLEDYRKDAYTDGPLPIGNEQTISQPFIVALMTQLLKLQGHERVLEIGTGSGYQTAILAKLAKEVWSIEMHPALSAQAKTVLGTLGLNNVHLKVGDGTLGWPESAPFDAMMVTAGSPQMPEPLLQQLTTDGRIVIPLGWRSDQELEHWQRHGGAWHIERITGVRFVPLVGKWGWKDGAA